MVSDMEYFEAICVTCQMQFNKEEARKFTPHRHCPLQARLYGNSRLDCQIFILIFGVLVDRLN
jgi:ferredoxin